MYVSQTEEIREGWIKLLHKELQNSTLRQVLYYYPNSNQIEWKFGKHGTHGRKIHTGVGLKNMKERHRLENTDLDVRIILKLVLEEKDGSA